jgi:hypothetical protein
MTIYQEEIYAGLLHQAVKGTVIVQSGSIVHEREMPVLVLIWWQCPGKGIVAMTHQSLE